MKISKVCCYGNIHVLRANIEIPSGRLSLYIKLHNAMSTRTYEVHLTTALYWWNLWNKACSMHAISHLQDLEKWKEKISTSFQSLFLCFASQRRMWLCGSLFLSKAQVLLNQHLQQISELTVHFWINILTIPTSCELDGQDPAKQINRLPYIGVALAKTFQNILHQGWKFQFQ